MPIKTAVLILLSLLIGGAPAYAAVLFSDGFESAHLRDVWSTDSCTYMEQAGFPVGSYPWIDGCNPKISTDFAHSGTHSLKGDYTGPLIPDGGTGASGVWVTAHISGTRNVWTRYWFRMTGGVVGGNSKHSYVYDNGANPSWVGEHMWGDPTPMISLQGAPSQLCPSGNTGQGCSFSSNISAGPIKSGEWYCIEEHVDQGTPGGLNGTVEVFVTGPSLGTVQTVGYYNRPIIDAAHNTSGFTDWKLIIQGGMTGYVYFDDVAMGDSRIGCGGVQPLPPPGAVGAVSNLSVASVGANSATLSFTEVDDGTGQPAIYDIRFLSPVMNWGSASSVAQGTCATPLTGTQIGATKTCTVLGLSPGTDYQFQLVPFRGTMNVDAVFGALSNIAGVKTVVASDVVPPARPRNMRAQ